MGLTDSLLALAGHETPAGRRPVCVVCPEFASQIDASKFVLVAVPGARVAHRDGDVARGVALVAASVGGTLGGADVLVVGHEGCVFRAPSFAVPGPPPQGESFSSVRELVQHSVAQLAASPWMSRTHVHGAVVSLSGSIEPLDVSAAHAPAAAGGYAPGPAALAPAGPVSFFGAGGSGPGLGEPPPPIAPSAASWQAPAPPPLAAPTGSSFAGSSGASFAGTSGAAFAGASAPHKAGRVPPPSDLAASLSSLGTPPPLMPTVGEPPAVSAEMPTVRHERPPGLSSLEIELSPTIDVSSAGAPPPPPAPPKPAPPRGPGGRRDEPPPAPPPKPHGPSQGKRAPDDPFARAEEILERLRRERRR